MREEHFLVCVGRAEERTPPDVAQRCSGRELGSRDEEDQMRRRTTEATNANGLLGQQQHESPTLGARYVRRQHPSIV